MNPSIPTRRFVTGQGADGRSLVIIDDHAGNVTEIAGWPGLFVTELWVTEESPVDNSGVLDRGARPMRHDPVPGGSIFRIVEIPPETGLDIDPAAAFTALGSHNKPSAADSDVHPSMHHTDSIDYLVVLSGEMDMVMEDGVVRLRPGDCIVQRGTNHAWRNTGSEPCRLAAVLIDARPLAAQQ